jgi:hypothetical protein
MRPFWLMGCGEKSKWQHLLIKLIENIRSQGVTCVSDSQTITHRRNIYIIGTIILTLRKNVPRLKNVPKKIIQV